MVCNESSAFFVAKEKNMKKYNINFNPTKTLTVLLAFLIGVGGLNLQAFAEDDAPATTPSSEASENIEQTPSASPEDSTAVDESINVNEETGDGDNTSVDKNINPELAEGAKEDGETRIKASFNAGVAQQEDGTFVWNVDTEEKEHTFAYRLELSKLDQTQVKVLVPSTVFRNGEEGDFIASDLESDNSKLHLKVYEILTDEDGTETKLEVKNERRKEEPTDGVSAIVEANEEVQQGSATGTAQGASLPDTSAIEEEQKYSEHYISQLSEESGALEISSTTEEILNNSVLQIEYTVEDDIYGNVYPQVFTAVLDLGDVNSDAFVECESDELEFNKNDNGVALKKETTTTINKDDNALKAATNSYSTVSYDLNGGTKDTSVTNPNNYKIINDGLYTIQTAMGSGRYVHVRDANIELNSSLVIWETGDANKDWQTGWMLERHGNTPYYYIISKLSGLALSISGDGDQVTADTRSINLYSQQNGGGYPYVDYLWYFKDAGNGYVYICNKKTDTILDVLGASDSNGTYLQAHPNNGGSNQKWKLNLVQNNATSYITRPFSSISPVVVNPAAPLKTGYKFLGWNTKKDGTGTMYQPGAKIIYNNSSITLYAQWEINSYGNRIEHWAWGFNGEGNNKDKKAFKLKEVTTMFKYNQSITYTDKNAVELPNGFQLRSTFEGDIEGSWASGYTMGKSFTQPAKMVVMEYNYDPITYNITYNLDGGTLAKSNPSTYNVLYGVNFTNAPTKTGYDFAGWYIGTTKVTGINVGANATFSSADDMYAKLKTRTTGNQTVTAKWTAKKYSIWLFNQDGQDTQVDSAEYNSNISSIFHFSRCPWSVPTGYKFAGWFTAPTGGTKYTGNEKVTGEMTLYAQYTPVAYTITYNLNGGSISGQKTSYNVETTNFTLPTPTRCGYTFSGWTGTGLSSATKSVTVAKGSTGNRSYTANWTANSYTYNIKYVSKSGVALGTATVSGTFDSSKNVTAPAKTGYSTPVAQNVAFNSVNAKTITFTYTPVDYAITYNLAGGSISDQKASYNIETASFTLPTPTRSGYTFSGWTGTGLSSATKTVTVAKGSTGARSYTATWAPVNYTITYNLDGGSIRGQKTSYNIETADFTLPTPSKTGHTFLGWTGTGLSSATKSVTVAKDSTGNRSYTANWSINQYDIILKGDAGTESVTYGGRTYPLDATHSVTIRANYNTNTDVTYKVKPKYHIASETGTSMSNTDFSWSNNIGKEGSTGGQTWTTREFTRTITIKTASNQFTVAFNANTGTGTMSNQSVTNNANQKINANAFKKAGYTFKNWNTSANGTGTTYANNVAVDSIAASNGATVTLYAQWAKDTYTISYNLNGGSATGNPTSYQVDTADITLKNPSKAGYSFAGWTGSNGSTAQTTVKIAKGSTGNKSYTANWTANTYSYTLDLVSNDGMKLGTVTVGGEYGTTKTITPPEKAGYKTPAPQTIKFDSTTPKTITFKYEPITYTITYDLAGGSISGQKTSYNIETANFTLPIPTCTGYEFLGWTGSNGDTPQKSVAIAKGSTGNKSYKANWSAKKVTVSFYRNINSSDTTVTNKTYTYDVANQKFSDCGYTYARPGYTLLGWAFKADATEPDYTTTSGVVNSWIDGKSPNIKLYAVWKPKTGTLTYTVEGGGTVSRASETVSGNNTPAGAVATAKTGYHFDGWYNNYGEKVSADATIKPGTPTAFNGLRDNYYGSYDLKYDSSSGVYSVTIDAQKFNSNWGSGFGIIRSDEIPYGKWYICSFEIYSPVDAHVEIDMNNCPVSGDAWHGNDNDAMGSRHYAGRNILANTWTTIIFGYQNSNENNTNKVALYDHSGIGVKYDTSKGDQTIKIRNIQSMVADSYVGSASKYIAKFSRNTYTIKYDGNGADSGTMENTVHEYHDKAGETGTVALRKNAFQKTGYTFKGWHLTRKNGNNLEYYYTNGSAWGWYQEDKLPAGYQKYLYANGEGSSNATTVDGEVLTAVAQWEKLTNMAITNTVSGNMGNKSKYFTYTLQLPSSFNGTKLTVVDGSGSTSTVTIGSDCKLSFTLKHGQSYTIKELNEAQFNSIKGLTSYGISETSYAEEGYKTSSTTKMDAHGNIQLIFNNQNGSALPTGIILTGSGMGIIVALVIAIGWLIKHKFIK